MAHKLPAGASVLIPRLVCRDPKTEIDFLTGALGARELSSRTDQAGKVVHALLTFGPAMFMVEGEWPQVGSRAPQADGSSSVVLYLYVEDVDKTVEQATAAGAKLLSVTIRSDRQIASVSWDSDHELAGGVPESFYPVVRTASMLLHSVALRVETRG